MGSRPSNSEVLKAKAIEMLSAGLTAQTSTGATSWGPWFRAHLGKARAELAQFDEAWSDLGDAMR
jgi:hypothetical protein